MTTEKTLHEALKALRSPRVIKGNELIALHSIITGAGLPTTQRQDGAYLNESAYRIQMVWMAAVDWVCSMLDPLAAAHIAGQSQATKVQAEPVELAQVQEQIKKGAGFWHTCSGCHESEDGHDNGSYPYSAILGCKLGMGCSECGGIGAVWDNIDYEAMHAEMDAAPTAQEVTQQAAQTAPAEGNVGWAHDLQKRLMVDDDQGDDDLHNLLGEVACCLAALTGRPDTPLTPAPVTQQAAKAETAQNIVCPGCVGMGTWIGQHDGYDDADCSMCDGEGKVTPTTSTVSAPCDCCAAIRDAEAIHGDGPEGAQKAPEEVADVLSACRGYVQCRLDEGTRTKDPIIIEAAEGVMERIEQALHTLNAGGQA